MRTDPFKIKISGIFFLTAVTISKQIFQWFLEKKTSKLFSMAQVSRVILFIGIIESLENCQQMCGRWINFLEVSHSLEAGWKDCRSMLSLEYFPSRVRLAYTSHWYGVEIPLVSINEISFYHPGYPQSSQCY